MIAERATWFRGRIDQINWRIMVRFERRLAKSFGQNRVWLAGDAGHLTGPAGMHSMNVGLREALDLAAILDGVLHKGTRSTRCRTTTASGSRNGAACWDWATG